MNEGEGGFKRRVDKIGKHLRDLIGDQHALVDDRVRGETRDIEEVALRQRQALDGTLDTLANYIQHPLELGVPIWMFAQAGRPTDKELPYDGLAGFGRVAEMRIVRWHVTPTDKLLPFLRDDVREDAFDAFAFVRLAWQ